MKTIILALVIACAGVSHAARFGSAADPMYVVSMSTYAYISGEAKVTGNSYFGAELDVTTNTAATGAWAFPATVSIGGAMDVAGASYFGAADTKSTAAANGTISAVSFTGSGSGLTAVPAASIAAGSLGGSVIASSIAISAVQDGSIVALSASKLSGALPAISGASLTALTAANISAGSLIIGVGPYQSANCESLTPAAEGKWCYDTTLHTLSISTSTAAGGFAPLTY